MEFLLGSWDIFLPLIFLQGCQLGKHTALPLTSSTTQTYAPFKLIHSAGSCSCFVKKWLCILSSICFLLYSFHLELHRRSDFMHVSKYLTTMIATEFSARMLFFRRGNSLLPFVTF